MTNSQTANRLCSQNDIAQKALHVLRIDSTDSSDQVSRFGDEKSTKSAIQLPLNEPENKTKPLDD